MMNTVSAKREAALRQGEIVDLSADARKFGLPLELAITTQAHKACLDGQNDHVRKAVLEGVEAATIVAFVVQQPPQPRVRVDYRSALTLKNSDGEQRQTVHLTLRVNFTREGIPCSATLGLKDETLPC
ncbi:TPA: hypothetical protein ACG04Z_003837 [Klebsiella aerogenes]